MVQISINKHLVTLRGGTWSCADKDLAAGLAGIDVREGATELEHAIDVAKATGGTIVLIDEPSCHQVIKPVAPGASEGGQLRSVPPPAPHSRRSRH